MATPGFAAWVARLSSAAFFALMMVWLFEEHGGLSLQPAEAESSGHSMHSDHRRRLAQHDEHGAGGNDTSPIFNFHAFFFTLAYVVCMAESLLAYRSPIWDFKTRWATKAFHHALQALTVVFTGLGLAAVVVSKDASRPAPYKHVYSGHAWMGLLTILAHTLQYAYGLWAFVFSGPRMDAASRAAAGRTHGFLGLFVWGLGLATVTNGFIDMQMMMTHSGTEHYSDASLLPAGMCVCATALAAAVFWIFHDRPQLIPGPSAVTSLSAPGKLLPEGEDVSVKVVASQA